MLKVNTPFWGPRNDKKKDVQGTHGTGKTGKMAKEIPCHGKHRELGNFAKTQGIWFVPSCKFSDCISQFSVCNSQNSRKLAQGRFGIKQGKNRENTGI